ncbi:tripartite tricarboxylate transporter TctB family protein [soil metagenome]
MKQNIKSMPDLISGLFFIIVGLTVAILASEYNPGTAARMGPGYFPRLLGTILVVLGIGITFFAFKRKTIDPENANFPLRNVLVMLFACAAFWVMIALVGKRGITGLDIPAAVLLFIAFFASREMFWVLGGIAAFAVLLQPAGLVISSFALIVIGSLASHEFTWKATLVNFVVLTIMCWAVFVWGLNLQFPVLPAFLSAN